MYDLYAHRPQSICAVVLRVVGPVAPLRMPRGRSSYRSYGLARSPSAMASAEASAPAPALARCAETDGSPRKDSKGFFTLPSLDHSREYPLYRGVARLFSQGARLSLSTLPDELSEGDIILFSGRLMADRCLRCVLRSEYNHVGIIVRQSIHDELQVPLWPRVPSG